MSLNSEEIIKDVGLEISHNIMDGQKNWLESLPDDFESILDIGSGHGFHAKYFKDKGHSVTALDIDGSRFLFKDEIKFYSCPVEELPEDEKFDAILISHVLEHCPNPYNFMQSLRSRLNDNGYIFIAVPSYVPLVCNDHWYVGWNISQLAIFLVSCGFDCRSGIFEKNGFQVLGFGRKADLPYVSFCLQAALDYLPEGFKKLHYEKNGCVYIYGQVDYVCQDKIKFDIDLHSHSEYFSNFAEQLTIKHNGFAQEKQHKKGFLYGAGLFAKSVINYVDLSNLNILGFIDNDPAKKGKYIGNYKIYSLNEAAELNPDYVILSVAKFQGLEQNINTLLSKQGINCELISDYFEI